MSNNIRRDVEALADLGMGPDAIDRLAAMGMPAGAFADFRSLDTPTRQLVLRLLDDPSEADFRELDDHATGEALAKWLLTLPAYVNAGDEDDE